MLGWIVQRGWGLALHIAWHMRSNPLGNVLIPLCSRESFWWHGCQRKHAVKCSYYKLACHLDTFVRWGPFLWLLKAVSLPPCQRKMALNALWEQSTILGVLILLRSWITSSIYSHIHFFSRIICIFWVPTMYPALSQVLRMSQWTAQIGPAPTELTFCCSRQTRICQVMGCRGKKTNKDDVMESGRLH